MSFLLTGSGFDVAALCAPSAALPQARRAAQPWTDLGIWKHHYLSKVAELGVEAALAQVPAEFREACRAIKLDRLPLGERYETEVTFAIDFRAGVARRVGRHLNRKYKEAGIDENREVPLTLDVVTTEAVSRAEGMVTLADYKGPHADVSPAVRNWQLKIGAVASTRAYGLEDAEVSTIRLLEGGDNVSDLAVWDCLDLEDHYEALRAVYEAVLGAKAAIGAGAIPNVVYGDHCLQCSAVAACPRMGSMLAVMASSPETWKAGITELVRFDPAGAWRNAKIAEKLVDEVKAALKALSQIAPLTLDDGYLYGPREVRDDSLDGQVVAEVVRRLYPEVEQIAAPSSPIASKASIRRAAEAVWRSTDGAETISAIEERILDATAEKGGIISGTKLRTEAHRDPLAPPRKKGKR